MSAQQGPEQGGPRVDGRVAVVTGAGVSGPVGSIGRAIAVVLARAGASVCVVDREPAAAAATVAEIEAMGGTAAALVGDVTVEHDCERMIGDAGRRFGRLDILVNNVGVAGSPATVEGIDCGDWNALLSVNLTSTLLMSKHALPAMTSGAAVVNISSTAAARPGLATAYGPAKAGVEALTRATAVQFGPRGIRANCVAPGPVWTDLVARMLPGERGEARREQRRLATALQAEGTAWDIAAAALFLASDQSRWITGQVLTVDGGARLLGPS